MVFFFCGFLLLFEEGTVRTTSVSSGSIVFFLFFFWWTLIRFLYLTRLLEYYDLFIFLNKNEEVFQPYWLVRTFELWSSEI